MFSQHSGAPYSVAMETVTRSLPCSRARHELQGEVSSLDTRLHLSSGHAKAVCVLHERVQPRQKTRRTWTGAVSWGARGGRTPRRSSGKKAVRPPGLPLLPCAAAPSSAHTRGRPGHRTVTHRTCPENSLHDPIF